jgi:DNA-binding XRE family transcriptional regulator
LEITPPHERRSAVKTADMPDAERERLAELARMTICLPRLREARLAASLTQQTVANALGFKRAETIRQWETGYRPITGVELLRICAMYGLDPRKLLE